MSLADTSLSTMSTPAKTSGSGRKAPKKAASRAEAGGKSLSPQALDLVAQRFKVLSDPARLALVQHLMAGEQTVGALCIACKGAQANTSRQLAILHDEGILARRKEGLHVYYSIADSSIEQLCELVCSSLSRRLDQLRDEFPDA